MLALSISYPFNMPQVESPCSANTGATLTNVHHRTFPGLNPNQALRIRPPAIR